MRKNGHYDKQTITITSKYLLIKNTLTSEMFLRNNNEVDFRQYNSIISLLEFQSKLCKIGFHESEDMVTILTVNSILVNIDLISGSYVNGSTQLTIYSFFPNVSPGYNIIENPHNFLYLAITSDTIRSITVWPTDQD